MTVLQPPNIPVFYPHIPFTAPLSAGGASMASSMHDAFLFLVAPPVARLRRVTALTVAEGVHQFVAWDTADEDSVGGWSISDPTKYTVAAQGWYEITLNVSLSGTGAASMVITPSLAVNGASSTGVGTSGGQRGISSYPPTGAAAQPKTSNPMYEVYAQVGDILQCDLVYSTESAIVAVDITAGLQCSLELVHTGI